MKTPLLSRSSRSSGFTLVELLVVIAIIAILASVLAVSAGSVIRSANRAKVAATANQIQTAVLNYYTEYGVYPVPTAKASATPTDYTISDTSGDEATWADLIDGLSGNISPANGKTTTSTVSNSRGIVFLNLKNSDVIGGNVAGADAPKNLIKAGTTALSYNIAVDTDYDGILGTGNSNVKTMPNFATTPPPTSTTFPGYAGGGSSSAGVALWVNCTGTPAATTNNANFWVHTY